MSSHAQLFYQIVERFFTPLPATCPYVCALAAFSISELISPLSTAERQLYEWMDMEGTPQSIQWLFNRIHPDDLPRIRRGILNVMADKSQTHWLDECRIVRSDGMKEMKVLFRGYVCRDATGTARRMVGSLQDLTGRRTHSYFTK